MANAAIKTAATDDVRTRFRMVLKRKPLSTCCRIRLADHVNRDQTEMSPARCTLVNRFVSPFISGGCFNPAEQTSNHLGYERLSLYRCYHPVPGPTHHRASGPGGHDSDVGCLRDSDRFRRHAG